MRPPFFLAKEIGHGRPQQRMHAAKPLGGRLLDGGTSVQHLGWGAKMAVRYRWRLEGPVQLNSTQLPTQLNSTQLPTQLNSTQLNSTTNSTRKQKRLEPFTVGNLYLQNALAPPAVCSMHRLHLSSMLWPHPCLALAPPVPFPTYNALTPPIMLWPHTL